MKALTCRQPWAELIASGWKTIEVRSWQTNYRGDLLIAASARPDFVWQGEQLRTGTTHCVVTLVDVREFRKRDQNKALCDHAPGQFAWLLQLQYRTKHVAVKGRVGLWTPDLKIIRQE